MKIISGKIQKAQKVVIYGPEGIGKSTFASHFPGALFIDTEGSTTHLDVKRFERPHTYEELVAMVDYVIKNPTACQTLIIDTMDWAEILVTEYVCKKNGWGSIEDPGYGKGYVALAEEVSRLLSKLELLTSIGINVVLTAHATMRIFTKPDEAGAYDRWELKLQKKVAPLVKEWPDAILFINYETFITNKDKSGKGIAQGGRRVMYTEHRPAWDAKNRWGLTDKVDFSFDVIAPFIPTKGAEVKDTKEEAPKEAPEEVKINPILRQLMIADRVELSEVMGAVAKAGYYPAGTKYEDLPQDFVDQVLIKGWRSGLVDFIEKNRKEDKQ